MAHSQFPKKYKIYEFNDLPPLYDYIRTLSNGVHVCANDDPNFEDETAMNLDEISKYIKENHVDITDEII